jgi:orotidine-5'-phosphate decarboxylase
MVVGRPITQAPDPAEAAEAILREMAEALKQ